MNKLFTNGGGNAPPFQPPFLSQALPPHAPDSEKAIIGCLLLDNSLIAKVREILKPNYFYVKSNCLCFQAALSLKSRGLAIDPVQLAEELRTTGNLEIVGGSAHIASYLEYGIRSDFESHCERVIETATRRMIWVQTNRSAEATNNGQPIREILIGLREMLSDAESRIEKTLLSDSTLAMGWAEFDAQSFEEGERIAFAVERGEAALLNALPNAGKTTLSLNIAVSLAAGRTFAPVVTASQPRRVLYVDGETRRPRVKRDLRTMTASFSREEAIRVGQNLYLICEGEIGTESLALTRPDHWPQFAKEALRLKPDFIVIDTMVSLCPVFNENDNAEQQRRIWTPLQKLARDCNAAVLVLHHVGKRSEDSQTPESVYRGRGASAGGGFARAVWLLIPDPVTPGLSTLRCVKAKGETPKETRLRLAENRWFKADNLESPKLATALERVIEAVDRQRKTIEIVELLKPYFSKRAVEAAIAEAFRLGKIDCVKKGVYRPSAPAAPDSRELFADDAVSADGRQEQVEINQPHQPHNPIGAAGCADDDNFNFRAKLQSQVRPPLKSMHTDVRA